MSPKPSKAQHNSFALGLFTGSVDKQLSINFKATSRASVFEKEPNSDSSTYPAKLGNHIPQFRHAISRGSREFDSALKTAHYSATTESSTPETRLKCKRVELNLSNSTRRDMNFSSPPETYKLSRSSFVSRYFAKSRNGPMGIL
eukprot:TRINITY_DN357_c0_g1_i2.p2 TRINITY_DN357_c0_g1~~TRINITY_DN357_c0_g1_i2.p2  ORF type:complete len:144 (+),score=9.87 TRINITY_DN357_c0_g1_i2:246-677(+)